MIKVYVYRLYIKIISSEKFFKKFTTISKLSFLW